MPAFRGDSALTASLRTVERNPLAPTTRSYSPVLSSPNSTVTASAPGRKINNGKAEPVRDRAGFQCRQQTLQFHPSHSEARSDPAPQIGQISRAEQVAVSIVEAPRRQDRSRSPQPSAEPQLPKARTPFACIVIAAPVTGHCGRASTSSTVSPASFSAIAAAIRQCRRRRHRPTTRPSVSASHPKRDATSITPLLFGGVAVLENRSARRGDDLR